ncbi:hypothetical protein O2W15_08575 [Modestobacter sp. VKM Ac-2979]|uniref:hypothetical protein n=1 Tax=unclassified Modestobacter TaxID=2643866 RepID=UPI0022AB6BDB|nr:MULTISPECIES: hypothetical protein [unclassified Modestobacter]MCZ2811490.1 hypothetical protein [Modestobacter sp. VKM Ac-2979]MCZ2841004.1 hypothetical protein [Modestobacter sp. VKM Ac-2980]
MGRHSAGNGARVDPIVADALRQRTTSVEPGPPRHAPGLPDRQQVDSQSDGGLGWPGEPGEGSGLGWPDRDDATHPAADTTESATTEAATPVAPAAGDGRPAGRRFGWRRWLGVSPAASPAPSGSNAA